MSGTGDDVDEELTASLQTDGEDDDDTTYLDTIPLPREAPSLEVLRAHAAGLPEVARRLLAPPRARVSGPQSRTSSATAGGPATERDSSIRPPPPAEPSEAFHMRPTPLPSIPHNADLLSSSGPPTKRAVAPDGRPGSVAPVTWTEAPRSRMPAANQQRLIMAGGAALGVLGVISTLLVVIGGIAYATRPAAMLVVTGEGPAGAPVQVYVDGTLRCPELPCRLDRLASGTHLVHVDLTGKNASSKTARSLEDKALEEKPPSKNGALPATEASELPKSSKARGSAQDQSGGAQSLLAATNAPERAASLLPGAVAPIPRGIAAVRAKSFPDAPPAIPSRPNTPINGKGVLHLSATPGAHVVVDGRPLGKAPRSVHVAPGTHTVVFASGKRRKTHRVVVKPGAAANLAAKF